jgi:predicted component of type VI protein secretion system
MEARLVARNSKTGPRSWRLQAVETIIGRRHDCDLRILSAEVSRRHCRVLVQDGYLNVEDLDSVNGTFINGRKVVGTRILKPGDTLEIGPMRFVVEYELTQDALDRLQKEEQLADRREGPLEVLPDDAGEAVALPDDSQDADAIPLADVETELSASSHNDHKHQDDDAPIPVEDEAGGERNWNLPQTNELRDLLAQMEEDPQARRQKR